MALRMKGETVDELVGFARAMRQMAVPVDAGLDGEPLLDTCGTGGDGAGTFNISTVAAFVVAGAGVHVAKHGNRSISSQCGSADLLESLGIRIAMPPAETRARHPRSRHRLPVRARRPHRHEARPAGARRSEDAHRLQPAGPADQSGGRHRATGRRALGHAAELMAGALAALGLERGFVVHGSDGLDEITTTGPTLAFEIRDGKVERAHAGAGRFRRAHRARPKICDGGDQARNLEIANAVLAGARGPQRDIVLVNAAAALVAAGKADTSWKAWRSAWSRSTPVRRRLKWRRWWISGESDPNFCAKNLSA